MAQTQKELGPEEKLPTLGYILLLWEGGNELAEERVSSGRASRVCRWRPEDLDRRVSGDNTLLAGSSALAR